MTFLDWATKWQIPPEAVADYYKQLTETGETFAADGTSESAVQAEVRLEASRQGKRLMRNNVGAGVLENGRFMRWGLMNESEALNRRIKSHDLIGWQPVTIRHDHVGTTIAQFLSREVKAPGWMYSGTEREQAQLRFAELVNAAGGDAKFITDPRQL